MAISMDQYCSIVSTFACLGSNIRVFALKLGRINLAVKKLQNNINHILLNDSPIV